MFENMAFAYLAHGSGIEASKLARSGLAVMREDRIRHVATTIRNHSASATEPEQATSYPGLPRRIRYDEASVRVSAVIQSRYSRLPQGISVKVISGVS